MYVVCRQTLYRLRYCLIMTGPRVNATIPMYTCSQNISLTMTESPLTIPPQWQTLQATAPGPRHLLSLERAQPNPLNAWISLAEPAHIHSQWADITARCSQGEFSSSASPFHSRRTVSVIHKRMDGALKQQPPGCSSHRTETGVGTANRR